MTEHKKESDKPFDKKGPVNPAPRSPAEQKPFTQDEHGRSGGTAPSDEKKE